MLDINKINLMHKQFNIDCSQVPFTEAEKNFRLICMEEEIAEFEDAKTNEDLLDAMVDLVVFAIGTVERMGFLGVFPEAYNRVMAANMQKHLGGNKKRGDFQIDLVKPDGWEAPMLADLLPKIPVVHKQLPLDLTQDGDETEDDLVKATRKLRSSRYGSMEDIAKMTQQITVALSKGPGYTSWTPMHKECVHMITHKLCRMSCGDAMYADNAHDIAGYAQILDEWLVVKNGATK